MTKLAMTIVDPIGGQRTEEVRLEDLPTFIRDLLNGGPVRPVVRKEDEAEDELEKVLKEILKERPADAPQPVDESDPEVQRVERAMYILKTQYPNIDLSADNVDFTSTLGAQLLEFWADQNSARTFSYFQGEWKIVDERGMFWTGANGSECIEKWFSETAKKEDAERLINKMAGVITLEDAVETVAGEFITNGQDFSAHDVTDVIRSDVNNGSLVLGGVDLIDDVNSPFHGKPNIDHNKVRDLVASAYHAGKFPDSYSRVNTGRYWVYRPV